MRGVAEIIGELSAREAWTGRRLHGNNPHFPPRARPERDAPGAGGRLQGCEQVSRIKDPVSVTHISHALFFDQMPRAGQQPQDARDDLAKQRL